MGAIRHTNAHAIETHGRTVYRTVVQEACGRVCNQPCDVACCDEWRHVAIEVAHDDPFGRRGVRFVGRTLPVLGAHG